MDIVFLGDTRRRAGLPMAARYSKQKGDSIFESSLSNAFMYAWLAAHSLGLAAQPVSGVKYPKVQGLVKHLLNLPDFMYVYDILLVGRRAAARRSSSCGPVQRAPGACTSGRGPSLRRGDHGRVCADSIRYPEERWTASPAPRGAGAGG